MFFITKRGLENRKNPDFANFVIERSDYNKPFINLSHILTTARGKLRDKNKNRERKIAEGDLT